MTLHLNPAKVEPSICTRKESSATAGSGYPEVKTTTGGHSIFMMLEQAMIQVEYHGFTDLRLKRVDPFYKELCLIIAEVFVMDKDSAIKINGSNCCVRIVQEVYSQIRHDHVRLVFDNFRNVSQRIFNKKAYLRTALYNAVFEIESHYLNEMTCD